MPIWINLINYIVKVAIVIIKLLLGNYLRIIFNMLKFCFFSLLSHICYMNWLSLNKIQELSLFFFLIFFFRILLINGIKLWRFSQNIIDSWINKVEPLKWFICFWRVSFLRQKWHVDINFAINTYLYILIKLIFLIRNLSLF